QGVVGSGRNDLAGDGLLGSHGVDGDDAALEFQCAQQLGYGRNFVGFIVHLDLPERESVFGGPGAYDMGQSVAVVVGAAQGLAVNGNDLSLQCGTDGPGPAHEARQEGVGVDG